MAKKIEVLSREVWLTGVNDHDYVRLTDIARYKNPEASDDLIRNWLRNRNTLEFLGIWEHINNPGFIPSNSTGLKKQANLHSLVVASIPAPTALPTRPTSICSSSPLSPRQRHNPRQPGATPRGTHPIMKSQP
jgi:hypothetical protein